MSNARDIERPPSSFVSTGSTIPSFVSVSGTIDSRPKQDELPATHSSRAEGPSDLKAYPNVAAVVDARAEPGKIFTGRKLPFDVGGMRTG